LIKEAATSALRISRGGLEQVLRRFAALSKHDFAEEKLSLGSWDGFETVLSMFPDSSLRNWPERFATCCGRQQNPLQHKVVQAKTWRVPMQRDMKVVKVDARAIDVGYFNVKYTNGRKAYEGMNQISTHLFPSLAPRVATNRRMSDSTTLRADGCMVEVAGVTYFVGKDSVFQSTGKEPRSVLPNYSASDKYLALMRGALNYMAEDAAAEHELVIDHLVLGLPLNNFSEYRDALKERALGEHLIGQASGGGPFKRVTVNHVTVMVQPQGALLNFGAQNPQSGARKGWTLVVDAGGGTLDWFVSQGRVPNWARSGAYPKSMLACAYAVADQIDPDYKNQFEVIEIIDEAIRHRSESFKLAGDEYQMSQFQSSIDAVLRESVDAMLSTIESTAAVSTVLMTGGGAKVFQHFIAKHHPKLAKIMELDPDSVFSNVRGFQIAAEIAHPGKR
jgi:plasmid segregation protein ParM